MNTGKDRIIGFLFSNLGQVTEEGSTLWGEGFTRTESGAFYPWMSAKTIQTLFRNSHLHTGEKLSEGEVNRACSELQSRGLLDFHGFAYSLSQKGQEIAPVFCELVSPKAQAPAPKAKAKVIDIKSTKGTSARKSIFCKAPDSSRPGKLKRVQVNLTKTGKVSSPFYAMCLCAHYFQLNQFQIVSKSDGYRAYYQGNLLTVDSVKALANAHLQIVRAA